MEQSTQEAIDLITAKDIWELSDCSGLVTALAGGADAADKFKAMLAELESANPAPKGDAALKIGLARYALSRFDEALEVLDKAPDKSKDRYYTSAMCCKLMGDYATAEEHLSRAIDLGWDPAVATEEIIECKALAGDIDGARKGLDKIQSQVADTAAYAYLDGLLAELAGNAEYAAQAYDKAHDLDPDNAAITFRLAQFCDRHGNDEDALELYKECCNQPPVHVGALVNLAIMYEDAGDYDSAELCLCRVLESNPAHMRARLFLRDVDAGKTMYFDEDQARRIARHNAVLDIPVTDFELSVRARNCLKKMNIRCLGDLVVTTEVELLAYKNFGETSLREIKEMLDAKGLHLGQGLEEDTGSTPPTAAETKAVADGILATPLSRIEFSVRARSALESLGATVLGDLAGRTEAELLACRNFGQSSLNEVRQRLAEHGLRFREP